MIECMAKLGIGFLNLIYFFLKLLPRQKKIVYLSRQQRTVPLDFQMIADQVKKDHPNYRNVMLVKMIDPGLKNKLAYCFFTLKQMYHLATARAAVIDTYCIPVCILKQRKDLTVIQIWHALGAFKRFSFSILDQEEGRSSKMARLMHMHENYTYVLTSSAYCSPYFQEAFGVRADRMRVIPLPRVDYMTDPAIQAETRRRIYAAYPRLENTKKKVLVYAPTFRKYEVSFAEAVKAICDRLDFSRYELIVKLHPLTEEVIDDPRIIFDRQFMTHEMLLAADGVIADYSAVIFEAALLDRPLYFIPLIMTAMSISGTFISTIRSRCRARSAGTQRT